MSKQGVAQALRGSGATSRRSAYILGTEEGLATSSEGRVFIGFWITNRLHTKISKEQGEFVPDNSRYRVWLVCVFLGFEALCYAIPRGTAKLEDLTGERLALSAGRRSMTQDLLPPALKELWAVHARRSRGLLADGKDGSSPDSGESAAPRLSPRSAGSASHAFLSPPAKPWKDALSFLVLRRE